MYYYLQIIPLAQNEIDSMVATFRMLSDEVRRNIPDILLATMNILFTKHKVKNGILFSKLLWPTVRKNCSSVREKL